MPPDLRCHSPLQSGVCASFLLALAVATTASAPLAWTYTTGNYSWAVAVSQDGRYVISGSDDMHVYFFESESGKLLWSYAMEGYVRHVAISKNGTSAAAGDAAGNVTVLRSDSGEPVCRFRSDSPVQALALSEDGDYLAVGDRSGTLDLLRNGAACSLVERYVVPGGVLALSLLEPSSLAVTSTRGGLYFFEASSSSVNPAWSFGEDTTFRQVEIVNESRNIVAGGTDGYVYLFDGSGRMLDRQRVGGAVTALSVAEVTRQVALGDISGTLALYEIADQLTKTSASDFGQPIVSVAISDRGERISAVGLNGAISTYDQSPTDRLWTYNAGAIVHTVSVSRDGLVTAAASDSGSIYVFNEKSPAGQASIIIDPVIAYVLTVVVIAIGGYLVVTRSRKQRSPESESGTGKAYASPRATRHMTGP